MSVFLVDVSDVVQHLLAGWLGMRPVKIIPFVSENSLVQKIIKPFGNSAKVLKRVHFIFGNEANISCQYLPLCRVMDHYLTLKLGYASRNVLR